LAITTVAVQLPMPLIVVTPCLVYEKNNPVDLAVLLANRTGLLAKRKIIEFKYFDKPVPKMTR